MPKSKSLTLLFAHLTVFPLFYAKSKSFMSLFAHSFFFKERVELFASIVLYKRVSWFICQLGILGRCSPIINKDLSAQILVLNRCHLYNQIKFSFFVKFGPSTFEMIKTFQCYMSTRRMPCFTQKNKVKIINIA